MSARPTPARLVGAAALAVLLGTAGTAGATGLVTSPASGTVASRSTSIAECAGHRRSRPSSLSLACGDGGAYLVHVRWGGWGANTAQGFGTFEENTCEPNCAAGNARRTKVVASATALRGGRYTRLEVRAVSSGELVGRWSLRADGPARRG